MQHLQLIIAIAGAVAWWLSQGKRSAPTDDGEAGGKTFADPELAERTRRIRDEIQRKIEQRSRGYTAPTPAPARPAPAPDPELAGLPPILRELVAMQQPEPPPRVSSPDLETRRNAEMLEQQAALAEKLKQAEEMNAAAERRRHYEMEIASKEAAKIAALRGAMLADLRSPASLRRAFLLREVLGPPVALR